MLAKTTALDAAEDALALAQTASQAVTAAETALANLLNQFGIEMDGDNVLIPNVTPDVGLSPPYNSLFTLFGQFFDHGLDLSSRAAAARSSSRCSRTTRSYVAGQPRPTSWC